MRKLIVYLFIMWMCYGLTACQKSPMFRGRSQEEAFLQQYVGQTYYTAIVLRPFEIGDDYLIDLTGDISEAVFELPRATAQVALGTPITITGIEALHVLAHIEGYAQQFRILVQTKDGSPDDLAQELKLVLSRTPPLQHVRPQMQPFIADREITQGMSRKEVYMSWGRPDKVNSSPGSSGYLEEWIYFNRPLHLYLKDGFVTNWQVY
ncbi:MAG: hypothetical protein O7G88_19055 [bacterium]|nr:hypothetical protein [bacterium]